MRSRWWMSWGVRRELLGNGAMLEPDSKPKSEQTRLSWLGKILALVVAAFTFCIAFPLVRWINELMGWEKSLHLVLVIPIVLIGFGFWVAACKACEALGLPTDTVETRLVRARRLLRQRLVGKV